MTQSISIPQRFDAVAFSSFFGESPESATSGYITNVPEGYAGDLTEFTRTAQKEQEANEEADALNLRNLAKLCLVILREQDGDTPTPAETQFRTKSKAALLRMYQRGDI